MLNVNPVPNVKVVNAPLDTAETLSLAAPAPLATKPTHFRRVHVEKFCDECGGTGVIDSDKSPCFTCNGLGYNRVAVNVPDEEG
jgi:hypothetical protein